VAIIADPTNCLENGKYYAEFKDGAKYIEKKIITPNGETGSYRIYKEAKEAAAWINECFALELSKLSSEQEKSIKNAPLITKFSPLYNKDKDEITPEQKTIAQRTRKP
jgi:hypothetical protein